ncbi:hypothetical protein [Pseudoduganella sp. OTU4001]|uniref:hypothetical protein n=1 Tax=Pseudoduganella sp. OTU4001 TaxID=3043854 RepID=UPI00313F29E8
MHISASNERFTIAEGATETSVRVPSFKNIFFILFIGAWLVGWYLGETSAIRTLTSGVDDANRTFTMFWLAGWTLGGIWAVITIAWQLLGYEILTIDHHSLTQRIEVLGIGINKTYRLQDVRDLRTAPYNLSVFSNQKVAMPPLFGAGHGAISFDYGSRAIFIGASMDETEAKKVIAAFQRFLPQVPKAFAT